MKKKGFTLVELLAVIIVLSIVLMIAVAGYQKYISYTKRKAFNLEEKNFLSAARSAYADCLANKPVNEFCKYHTDLDTKYTYELIYLKELLEDQYIDEIKNPYDVEKSCNSEKSYIYASSKNNLSTSDNSQMEYKVCLVCGDKISEDCLSEEDDYYTFATTCKATYDSTSGTVYDGAWTDRDIYLSFGYEGEIRYGIDEYVYTIGGSSGGSVDANRQTYLANLKISKNVGAKEYKVQAFDGMNGKGNNVSCGVVRVDKAPITSVSVSISAKTTSGTKVNSDTWAMENVVLTANTNPGTSTSGYLYQWYKNGEKFGSQTTSNTLSVTGRGTYKVEVTNRVELAKGSSGKSVMSSDFIVKIDTKKPTCTLAVTSGTVGKNGIYVSDIAIAFASTNDMETDIDQGSGIVSQTIDYSKITDNVMEKIVTGTVKDAVGRTDTCTLTLSKDAATPSVPTITVSDSIASGSWHKNDFTIKLSGASNVSQNEYYYSTNKDAVTNANVDSKSNVTTGTTITLNTNTISSGTTYYYKVCSKAGKCSSVGSYLVKLDKNDPVFTVAASDSIASGSWHTANYTVTASGASNVSGNTYYSGTASNPTTTGASQSVSTNSTTANGITYYFKVCSGAGRCVTKSYVAKLDKSTPSFTVAASDGIASGAWHTANYTITASGASNVSGNTYYYGTASNPTTTGATQSISNNTSNTTYYFKVCSGAGICSTKSYVAYLDKNAPTCSIAIKSGTAGTNGWYISNVTVGFSSTNDVGSAVASKSISNGSTSVTDNFVVSTDGTTTLNATITDSAGNVGTCGPVTVKRDATVPTCSSFAKSNTGTTSGVTLTATCADSTSTLAGYYISTSSTKPSASASGWSTSNAVSGKTTGTYYVFAKDNAGNVSAYKSASVTAQAQVRSCSTGNACAAAGYSCSSGDSLSGTTCTKTTTSTYAATASCPSGYTSNGTNCTKSWISSYYCPNGGTLSGTTCNVSGSYDASKGCSTGSLNSSGTSCSYSCTKTCSDSFTASAQSGCSTANVCSGKSNCSCSCDGSTGGGSTVNCTVTYSCSGTCYSSSYITYSCPNGGTLSGTTCNTSSSYGASANWSSDTQSFNYSCNSGDSLSNTTCTKTTTSTYTATMNTSIATCGCAAWGGWSNTTSVGSNSNSTQYQTLYY